MSAIASPGAISPANNTKFRQVADLLKLGSEPVRARLVLALRHDGLEGADLSNVVGIDQGALPHHLRLLRVAEAERIRLFIIEGNEQGLLAGLDADGIPFVELADATYASDRGGLGPPLSPRFSASRFIDRFKVTVEPIAGGGFSIKGGWPGVPEVEFFRTGTRTMPRRNPVGIRPETSDLIEKAVEDFAWSLIGGRSRFGSVEGF